MATLRSNDPDRRLTTVSFALQLFDAVTGGPARTGALTVTARKTAQAQRLPFKSVGRAEDATFVFCDLPVANYTASVRSNEETLHGDGPDYFARDIPFAVPALHVLWPALPDRTLADPARPLDDPQQTALYRAERRRATLWPTLAYPFSFDEALVRGRVSNAGAPVEGAVVQRADDPLDPQDPHFTTGPDGEFVLFFPGVGASADVSFNVTHALVTTPSPVFTIHRGMTVAHNITIP